MTKAKTASSRGASKKKSSRKKTSARSRPASSKSGGKPAGKRPAKKTTKKAKKTAKRAKKTATRKPKKTAKKPKKTAKKAKKTVKKTAKKTVKRAKKTTRKARKTASRKTATKNPSTNTAARTTAPVSLIAPIVEQKQAPKSFRRYYDKWRQRLIQLRQRLLGETTQLEEEALRAHEDEVSVDHMADYGSDSYEQEFTLSLIESKSEALRDVDDALFRIQEGTYGLCEECETMIPKGRLEVLPHARYCITCKSAMESGAF